MPINKYYQDELAFLRELREEFSGAYPKLAPFLSAPGNDPDVERLFEGFAFLAGRIRQKLDDELPELTHSLISLLWPHYLRPVPAMSIVQFNAHVHAISEKKRISRRTEVDSVPVDGTPCRFSTCYDVDLYPLTLDTVDVQKAGASSILQLGFLLHQGISIDKIGLDSLRLHLHGDPQICQSLYLWLCEYLREVVVQPIGKGATQQKFILPRAAVQRVGFEAHQELFPYPSNAFPGYRLLQEYFALPEKFLFVDITGLIPLAHMEVKERFEIIFSFSRPFEEHVRLTRNNLLLSCTPVVNLFQRDADPIRVDHRQTEYRIRPSARNPDHIEIYSVDNVIGSIQGSGEKRLYRPFLSFDPNVEEKDQKALCYRTKLVEALIDPEADYHHSKVDTYISFVLPSHERTLPQVETISIDLTCTNAQLPERLRAGDPEMRVRGDISIPTSSSPEFATFHNIHPVTRAVLPPLDQGLHWQLISNMSLHYTSLMDVRALSSLLSAYNFKRYYDRQAEREHELRLQGIKKIHAEKRERLFKGAPIRGLNIQMDMLGSKFTGAGDLYLLASLLNEFFALYATLNSFHELKVTDVDRREVYQWPAKIGHQPIL